MPVADFLAYTNPGVAGYVVQMLAAGAFGAFFLIKHYWRRITGRKAAEPPAETPSKPTD